MSPTMSPHMFKLIFLALQILGGVDGRGLIVPDLRIVMGPCIISISEPLKGARYDVYLLDVCTEEVISSGSGV